MDFYAIALRWEIMDANAWVFEVVGHTSAVFF